MPFFGNFRQSLEGLYQHGLGDYEDEATKTVPISVLAATPVLMACDALGSRTTEVFLPPKIITVFDGTTSQIILDDMDEGDQFTIRLDFAFDPSSPNSAIKVLYDFYDDVGAFVFQSTHFLSQLKSANQETFLIEDTFFVGVGFGAGGHVLCSFENDNAGDLEIRGYALFLTVQA